MQQNLMFVTSVTDLNSDGNRKILGQLVPQDKFITKKTGTQIRTDRQTEKDRRKRGQTDR